MAILIYICIFSIFLNGFSGQSFVKRNFFEKFTIHLIFSDLDNYTTTVLDTLVSGNPVSPLLTDQRPRNSSKITYRKPNFPTHPRFVNRIVCFILLSQLNATQELKEQVLHRIQLLNRITKGLIMSNGNPSYIFIMWIPKCHALFKISRQT